MNWENIRIDINKKVEQTKILLLLLITIFLSTVLFIVSTLGWSNTDIIYYAVGIVVSGSLIGICGCILVLIMDGVKK